MGSGNDIKQLYHPYWKWECYKSGMWKKVNKSDEDKLLNEAIDFTGDYIKYDQAMNEVIKIWKFTMENFLTNPSVNGKAHLGHCAVMYKKQIPEYITRRAWKMLTEDQRLKANKCAYKTIIEWKKSLQNTLNHGRPNVINKYQMTLPKEFLIKFRAIKK